MSLANSNSQENSRNTIITSALDACTINSYSFKHSKMNKFLKRLNGHDIYEEGAQSTSPTLYPTRRDQWLCPTPHPDTAKPQKQLHDKKKSQMYSYTSMFLTANDLSPPLTNCTVNLTETNSQYLWVVIPVECGRPWTVSGHCCRSLTKVAEISRVSCPRCEPVETGCVWHNSGSCITATCTRART